MAWLLFALSAMFFWAISNLLDKYIYSKLDVPSTVGWFSGLTGVMLAVFSFFVWGVDIPSTSVLVVGLISGVFYSGGMYAYIHAVKHDDISKLIALYNFIPIIVAILAAIFLGELFPPVIYFAILIMVFGALLISTDIDRKIRFTKGFYFIMLSVILFSISNVLDKYLLGFTDVPTVFVLIRFGFFITLIPFLGSAWRQGVEIYSKSFKVFALLIISSLLGVAGFVSLYFALSTGYITLVESLSAFQPLFVLIGVVLLSKFVPDLYSKEFVKGKIGARVASLVLLMIGSSIIVLG
jgi:drug/metabolite transporter (DMT)-like permease